MVGKPCGCGFHARPSQLIISTTWSPWGTGHDRGRAEPDSAGQGSPRTRCRQGLGAPNAAPELPATPSAGMRPTAWQRSSQPTIRPASSRRSGGTKNSCGYCSARAPSRTRPPRKKTSRPWLRPPGGWRRTSSTGPSAGGGKRLKSSSSPAPPPARSGPTTPASNASRTARGYRNPGNYKSVILMRSAVRTAA